MSPLIIVAGVLAASLAVVLFLIGFGVWAPEESVTIVLIQSIGLIVSKVIHQMKTPKKKGEPRGKKNKTSVMIVLLLLFASSGCTRMVEGDVLKMKVKRGPPCQVKVWMDGELIQESKATERCKVTVADE